MFASSKVKLCILSYTSVQALEPEFDRVLRIIQMNVFSFHPLCLLIHQDTYLSPLRTQKYYCCKIPSFPNHNNKILIAPIPQVLLYLDYESYKLLILIIINLCTNFSPQPQVFLKCGLLSSI